jgi:O-succinylbenzoic acid--CoA ligase
MPIDINDSKAAEKERYAFDEFFRIWKDGNDVINVRTSGSTGAPKEISLKKKDMITSAKQTLDRLAIEKGGSSLICLSMETIAGKMMAVRSFVGEMTVHLVQVNSNPLAEFNESVDLCAMVPLQLETTLKSDPGSLKRIKHLLIGGGPVSAELEKLAADHEISFWHTYGMTETISHVALRKAGKKGENFFSSLPGITFSQEEGRLIIHYPAIGIEHLKTNDLVELISPTAFRYLGRADFIINSGGIKFNPEELENCIAPIMNGAYFIGGIPDKSLGEKIVLFIEGNESSAPDKEDLKTLLPNYAIPKEIVKIDNFVRTESGKINRIETIKLSS